MGMLISDSSLVFERRRALKLAAGGAISGVISVWSRPALAQRGNFPAFEAQVKLTLPRAEGLWTDVRKDAVMKSPLPSHRQVDFAIADYDQRLRLAVAANGLGNDDLQKLVRLDMKPWATQFVEHKVRLVPVIAEVVPLPVASDQRSSSIDVMKSERIDVVADILLDALDLLEAKNMLKEILRNLPGFKERVEDISKAMKSGRADLVIDGLYNLVVHVFQATVASFILEKLPEAQRRRLLAALGVRFVPIFGWVYFGIAVALSATRHWERLRAA